MKCQQLYENKTIFFKDLFAVVNDNLLLHSKRLNENSTGYL